MKVILSRKGFDSEFGGYPSPILPNGQMISLPIPDQNEELRYSDVMAGDSTCYDLMRDLMPSIKSSNERIDLSNDFGCHLDPDIFKNGKSKMLEETICFYSLEASGKPETMMVSWHTIPMKKRCMLFSDISR